ncbi:hypothetical protein CPAR01_06379, partial [Colletotrichum paranaense]
IIVSSYPRASFRSSPSSRHAGRIPNRGKLSDRGPLAKTDRQTLSRDSFPVSTAKVSSLELTQRVVVFLSLASLASLAILALVA